MGGTGSFVFPQVQDKAGVSRDRPFYPIKDDFQDWGEALQDSLASRRSCCDSVYLESIVARLDTKLAGGFIQARNDSSLGLGRWPQGQREVTEFKSYLGDMK